MDIKEIYNKYLECTAVSIDTRNIAPGTMFFALKGENFNGNQYASDAIDKGAKYAVIDEEEYQLDGQYILVDNVLQALQKLASFHRRKLNIPVIAITGSNGKTTTKELVSAVLNRKYKTYATKGNLNNHIGVPLTLLSVKEDAQVSIVEMGANHQKEIEGYCKIAEPTHGIITNIGKAHLEGFGGAEGVKKGKGELYDYLVATNGVAFINSKNPILKDMSRFSSPVFYLGENDFYHCEFLEASPFIKFKAENGEIVDTQLLGKYNFENIAAALCIGKFFGVEASEANKAVASYEPQNNRSQVVKRGSNNIILDAYNANPSSMKAAIENFTQLKKDKKALILGDMFELGAESRKEHEALGKLISGLPSEKVILCGKDMQYAKDYCHHATYFKEKKDLEKWIKEQKFDNYEILIKGSRGMGLESLVDLI
jgi:UDP-N-acetylmuramoyl-tripeptide--D-alanyl-D-alanine ligase